MGEGVATLYICHLLPWFGLPKRIRSDQDPQFTSMFSTEICKQTGNLQNLSTAFRPQTDGQTERMNQWIEQYLRPCMGQTTRATQLGALSRNS
jgi:transposase InsO family protein